MQTDRFGGDLHLQAASQRCYRTNRNQPTGRRIYFAYEFPFILSILLVACNSFGDDERCG